MCGGSNVPPRIPITTPRIPIGHHRQPQTRFRDRRATSKDDRIEIGRTTAQREMERIPTTVNTSRTHGAPLPDHQAGRHRDARKVRVGRSNPTAVVDGHRPATRDRSCERDGSGAESDNGASLGGRQVNTPVPCVPTYRGEGNNDHRIVRQHQSVTAGNGRNHRQQHRERNHRTQHVPTPLPRHEHTASGTEELGSHTMLLAESRPLCLVPRHLPRRAGGEKNQEPAVGHPLCPEAVNLFETGGSWFHWVGVSSSGLLIHAICGSGGGVGGLRTNRSG